MSELRLEFVSKKVKDMYGTFIGKVVGIITDIEGSIESVSVDCGSSGIKNLPYEQLLVQGDYVIFIPRWRLDAQKLLREKSLTLKRIKALQEIVADNDNMKDDAELVYLKYEKRLDDLGENTKEIIERLHQRISEIDMESKRIKAVLFDAKLQYKSNEITDDIYQQITTHTNELIDHVNLEKTEINNIINKLSQQTVDNNVTSNNNEIKNDQLNVQNEDKEDVLDYNIQNPVQESEQDMNYNQGILQDQEQQVVASNAEDAESSTNEVTNYVEAPLGNNIENNESTHIMATNN
ncbi:MAG TPA: CdvA-like protein [Candidatus Nitrosocosmicus sp.]|nr:CdvA-like protein [Candidatus Nitrosocosmicus sp.]